MRHPIMKGRVSGIFLLFLLEKFAIPPCSAAGVCAPCASSNRDGLTRRNGNLTRIIGGTNAAFGDAPWQVALSDGKADDIFEEQFCGGVLINGDWVLTAAHCTEGMNARRLWVYVGLLDLHEPGQYFDQVKRKFEHKKYSGGWANSNTYTVDYDFALLKLTNGFDIPNIPNVSPACLPSMNKAPANVEVLISGWGTTSTSGDSYPNMLQKVTVQTMTQRQCKKAYRRDWTKPSICAKAAGKDNCWGDSGGPLIYDNDGRPELLGVTSWDFGCANPDNPGVYADVTNKWIKRWINRKTGGECT